MATMLRFATGGEAPQSHDPDPLIPMRARTRVRDAVFPGLTFLAVVAAHVAWVGYYPEADPVQSPWVLVPVTVTWWQAYLESGSPWLAYSYGVAAAFAAGAVQNFWRERSRSAGGLAIGGLTFSGGLAAAGCSLIGCCGSPMLVVWLSLLGTAALPFAQPIVAAVTTLTVGLGWWWMVRGRCRAAPRAPGLG